MKLPCGIYEYSSLVETEVLFFFEAQEEEDEFQLLGWARFDRSKKGWLKRPPIESVYCDGLLPDHIDEYWKAIYDNTPDEYSYLAEISEETVKIYEDGKLWLTLTKP